MASSAGSGRGAEVLRAEGLCKRFGETIALDDVTLAVGAGEVLGLCGHNGSGKSTLIKILSGYHHPDGEGRLFLRGEEIPLPIQPTALPRLGMGFVHQDLGIIDEASVIDNVRITQIRGQLKRVRWRDERPACRARLADFGLDVDPDQMAADLSAAQKTILAIVRSLSILGDDRPGLLVLDEPTTHLPAEESSRLFEAVQTLRSQGHGTIFVSHRLDEVLEHCDRVAVLRSGRLVGIEPAAGMSEHELAERIVGGELGSHEAKARPGKTDVVMEARRLSGGRLAEFDLDIRAGEIVGVTGLAGEGFEQVPYLLCGALPPEAGSVIVGGKSDSAISPTSSIERGVALVPDERLRLAAAGSATVLENLTLPFLDRYATGPVLRVRQERERGRQLLQEHSVIPPDPLLPFGSLSGGNQQKVVLARALASQPRVLLLHEPTQGVDIEARGQIYRKIIAAAEAGAAVLIASNEYEDLARFADRVIVVARGTLKSELSGSELTPHEIEYRCLVS